MSAVDWGKLVLTGGSGAESWDRIFDAVSEEALSATDSGQFERVLDAGDRLIADAAFELWAEFPSAAASAVDALRDWWTKGGSASGRAVLILDGLSVRE